jgi:hypothetical protein
MLKQNFDYTIPLGLNCSSANSLQLSKKRNFKLPFDWMQILNNDKINTYKRMIIDAMNNNLVLDIINYENNTYYISNYDAWIPHEPEGHTIEEIKKNYYKYFDRLIKILNSNSKILFVIMDFYNHWNDIYIIENYKKFFEELFPQNSYYFLTNNIGTQPIEIDYWVNFISTEYPLWKNINGVNTWTDPYLEKITEYCKNNVQVDNALL